MSWYLSGGQVVVAPGGGIFDDGGGVTPPPPGGSFDYYISTTGSDSSPGTLASPWAITAINSKRSTYATKRVGVIAGIYDISSLMTTDGANPSRNPALNINGGTSNLARTFIGACDTSGNYTIGAATLDAKGASGLFGGGNSNTNAIIGCNSTVTNRAFFTVAGLRIINGLNWMVHISNSPSGGTNVHDWTLQDCELTGQNGASSTTASGTNLGPLIIYMASNGLITNCYFHDNFGWTDPDHFSAVYQWGLSLTHDITYDTSTFINTGNIHSKESTQYNNTVQYCYIDMTLKTPSGGQTQNQAAIFGFNAGGGGGTLSSFHHNVIVGPTMSYICLSNDIAPNGWTTPVEIYNNTFVASGNQPAGTLFSLNAWETTAGTNVISGWNNLFWDNGFSPSSTYSYTTFDLDLGSGWDYNVYGGHNHYGTIPSGTRSTVGFVAYSSLAAWRSATGADTNASSSTASPVVGTGSGPAQYQLNTTGKAYTPKPATTTYVGAWDGTATQIGCSFAGNDGTFIPATGVTWTGSFTDGSTMTVTYPTGGLGARANALPLYYFPMETDLDTHPTLSRNSQTMTSASGAAANIQNSIMPVNAAGACQYTAGTSSTIGNVNHVAFSNEPYFTVTGGAGSQIYCFIKRYWAFANAPDNLKPWRIWKSGFNNPNAWFGYIADSVNEYAYGGLNQITSGIANLFIALGSGINAWQTDEHYWQENTFNTTNGIFNWVRNGKMTLELAGRWQVAGTADGAGPMTWVFGDEASPQSGTGYTGTPNGTTDMGYYGIMYCDDSFLQLLTTDEGSSYGTLQYNHGAPVAHREVQIQTSRTDTTITFVVRQGSLASLSGKNLLALTGYGTSINLGVGA